jgi:hypothetical protein
MANQLVFRFVSHMNSLPAGLAQSGRLLFRRRNLCYIQIQKFKIKCELQNFPAFFFQGGVAESRHKLI